MKSASPLKIVNSEFKDVQVVFLSSNQELSERIEAESEADRALQRIQIYSTTSSSEARDLVKRHGCNVAIFENGIDGKDFVSIQIELKHARADIDMIPLIDVPTISQIRESKRIGGVVDFEKLSSISDYSTFKTLLLGYLRERTVNQTKFSETFSLVTSLQSCLLLGHEDWKETKLISSRLTNQLLLHFDLSTPEGAWVMAAEKLFFPWITPKKYSELLPTSYTDLSRILSEAGHWGPTEEKPLSTAGFILTIANFYAERLHQGESTTNLVALTLKKPPFLKHPSITVLTPQVIEETLAVVKNGKKGKEYAAS